MDVELETYKTAIDLRAFAFTYGYDVDRKSSWRGSTVMRHANGDKIIISQKNGRFVYWNPKDDHDRGGTIIDFVAYRRKGASLRLIREELRTWTGTAVSELPPIEPRVRTDRREVVDRWAAMRVAPHHSYLENQRWIRAITLQNWRFLGRIKSDGLHRNAAFAHWDEMGLCGIEVSNKNFKQFYGSKGLALSKTSPLDRRLVICESFLDCLSYAQIFDDPLARFASLAGVPSDKQKRLLRVQIERMPAGAEIVAATDADETGRKLAAITIRQEIAASGREVTFRRQEPDGYKDWNDQLRLKTSAFRSGGFEEPSIV
jgi:hypothetical protein